MKHTAKDFSRKEIHRIATAYSTGKYTYIDFLDEYPGCSRSTFYDIISKAVVESIVSDATMEAIEVVAVNNSHDRMENISEQFANDVACRGRKCNSNRRKRRESYIKSYIPQKHTAIEWINECIATQGSIIEFCKSHYIPVQLFNRAFKNAIIKYWIRLDVIEQLRQKAYRFYDKQSIDRTFDILISGRKQLKSSKSKKAKKESQ